MGCIACCNVLSDLYAMGVVNCDNMLMLLGVSTSMKDKERDVAVKLMIQGFKDTADKAGTSVQGGQTVKNPWVTIGGVATSICMNNEFIMPDRGIAGDVLVLTKPLGTQLAISAYRWMTEGHERWTALQEVMTEEDVRAAYQAAAVQMARLNRNCARLLHKYIVHGATDVTGFGILGHANNLVSRQLDEVSFVIHNLPIIAKMALVSKTLGGLFGLAKGTCPETSGGLLVMMPRDQAADFCKEMEMVDGQQAWIIGIVEKGPRTTRIIDKPRIIDVTPKSEDC